MERFVFSLLFLNLLLAAGTVDAAESYDVAGGSFRAMREIDAPGGGRKTSVIVTQFMHQGLINLAPKGADPRLENIGKTVLITNRTKKPVPFKILQLGPGDYCRLAIQTEERTGAYVVYYGIPEGGTPNKDVNVPEWTAEAGLLFEARWIDGVFDMNNVESVKKAFEKSTKPIGADYVKNVYHGYNPLTLRREPFLSRYTGTLDVAEAGRYAVLTSSHHCSFLLIDGKVVASHPGRHGRAWQASPELVNQVDLSQGKHSFEYHHATGDGETSMLAVWELNQGEKPKFVLIPPEAFHDDEIARVPAGAVSFADKPGSPDFEYRILGSVPLPDNELQLIAVRLTNKSVGLAARGKLRWNFGDGQTSEEPNPIHIYLKPGIYSVQLTSDTASQNLSAVNRIEVDRPHLPQDPKNLPTLDQYLAVLEKYDASRFDPDSLLQLVEVYQAKIDLLLNPPPEQREKAETSPETAAKQSRPPRPGVAKTASKHHPDVDKYRRLIAETVRVALTESADFKGDNSIHKLALLAGGIARDYLGDWKLAGQIYVAAAKKSTFNQYAAECYALAADVSLDMQNKTAAGNFLQAAERKLSKTGVGRQISTFYRVQADYLAETGKGVEARQAIAQATRTAEGRHQYAERIALQGSASRSAENFIEEKNYERAIDALRTWQLEYPGAAYDGFMTLLFAKYWIGREKYPQAAALADRQLALNPDSSYIDELLFVAAEAQDKAGNKDAAKSYLGSLVKDYPGSPLVPAAREKLEKLAAPAN